MIRPKRYLFPLTFSIIAIFLSALIMTVLSCNTKDRKKDKFDSIEERQKALSNAMLDYNAARLQAELEIIDSLSTAWGWSVEKISGGIVFEKVSDSASQNDMTSVVEGDTVMWDMSASLINGVECFTQDSLQFVVGHSNQPIGFEEIASNILRGDSIRAILPSLMGYGIKGIKGEVPPGALLVLKVRQF